MVIKLAVDLKGELRGLRVVYFHMVIKQITKAQTGAGSLRVV